MSSLLIVLMGSLGDLARGVSVAAAVKNTWPACRITWMVDSRWEGLISGHPYIDRHISFNRRGGIAAVREVIKAMRSERYDVCLDMQRIFKSGIFSFLSGAPRRIGFGRRQSKELNWLFQTEHIPEQPVGTSKVLHYLEFAKQAGASIGDGPDFGLREMAEREPVPAAPQGPYLVVVLGSAWQSKDWFAEGYQKLLLRLAGLSLQVVFTGAPSQRELATKLSASVPGLSIVDLVGQTTIPQLVGLMARARAAIGPDSGPAHIAAALGTPYVTLFGPTDPARVTGWRLDPYIVKAELGCMPCERRVCPGLGRLCMRLIRPDQVFEKLQEALAGSATEGVGSGCGQNNRTFGE